MFGLRLGQVPLQAGEVGGVALEGIQRGEMEGAKRFFGKQLPGDPGHQGALCVTAREAQAAMADPGFLRTRAAVAVAINGDQRAAAFAAAQDAGEQVARWPALLAGHLERAAERAALCSLEDLGIDDGQLGIVGGDPFRRRAFAPHASPGFRVLHPVRLVPHLLPHVDGVRQDADAALVVRANGRCGPGLAAWRRHAFIVQPAGDHARRFAGQVFIVDPAHDGRLPRINGALPRAGDHVTVGQASGTGAIQGAAGQAAMGLLGQVAHVVLVDDGANAGVQLMPVAAGVGAVGHADQTDAVPGQPPQDAPGFSAVAAKPRHVVDQ